MKKNPTGEGHRWLTAVVQVAPELNPRANNPQKDDDATNSH